MDYKYITGLPLPKFLDLQDRIQQILEQRPRSAADAGGRPVVLTLRDQLILVLETLRFNLRQAYVATKGSAEGFVDTKVYAARATDSIIVASNWIGGSFPKLRCLRLR